MRKHFLILMLLTLLPLAGWADAFDLSTVSTVRAVYPQGVSQLVYNAQDRSGIAWTFEYQTTGSSEWVAIDKTECDIVFYGSAGNTTNPGDAVTVKNAGQYYVGITAKTNSLVYANAVPAAKRPGFEIQQFPMTIQANSTEKVYGDNDPTTLTWDVVNATNLPEPKENISITFTYQRTGAGTDEGEQVNLNGYDLTCTATADNYDITVTGSPKLVITPATLTVFYDANNGHSQDIVARYGTIAAGTALTGTTTDKVSFDGWKRNDAPAANADWAFGTLTLTPSAATANVGPTGSSSTDLLTNKTAHTAQISLSVVTKDGDKYVYGNYYVEYDNPALYVQQATIENASGAFTFAKDSHDAFTYDGISHAATYTIKYGTVGGTQQAPTFTEIETLTAGTDYTIDWKYGDAADTHNNKWAGTYTAIIKAVADGNYYTAADGVTLSNDALKYEIGQRDLAVYSEDDSKTYDGQAPAFDQNKIYWSGLIEADQTLATTTNKAAKDFFELKYVTAGYNTTPPTDVNTYKVIPAAKANVTASDLYTSLTTNYTNQFSQSNFKINPKAITITALPQSIKFGDAVAIVTTARLAGNNLAATVDLGEIVDGQSNTMLGYLELSLKAGTYTTADTYEDAIEVSLKDNTGLDENAIAEKTKFLNNYTLSYEPGNFVIGNATFKMFAKTNSVIYGDTYDLTSEYGFDYGTLDFSGEIAENATITYTLEKNGVELEELPTDAGTYQINVRLATEDIPAGYDAPTYIQGTFTIQPRPITVTPVAQALQKGAAESELETYNTNDSKVTFSYTGDNTKTAVIGSDAIDYSLIFNVQTNTETGLIPAAQVQNTGTQEAPVWKLIANATETTYAAGITVKAGVNANYVVTAGTGALTVIGANTLVLDRNDADLIGKINAAAAACAATTTPATTYSVKFANRKMKAQKWYAMVLPFPTSVSELSSVLGYAVVNVLKEQNDANKVQFKLYMEEIAANTPFLVKVYNAANTTAGDYQYGVDLSAAAISFTQKTISTVPTNGLVEATDGTAGNKFIGTYKAQSWTETSDYRWILNSAAGEEGKFQKCDVNPGSCSALGAYLETASNLDSFARSIFVEEPDGSTTAINTITGEQINFVNDAWYTLNGVKLNGMPTEKGVYINNGKKIVIK